MPLSSIGTISSGAGDGTVLADRSICASHDKHCINQSVLSALISVSPNRSSVSELNSA
jgi:hypothetical protein